MLPTELGACAVQGSAAGAQDQFPTQNNCMTTMQATARPSNIGNAQYYESRSTAFLGWRRDGSAGEPCQHSAHSITPPPLFNTTRMLILGNEHSALPVLQPQKRKSCFVSIPSLTPGSQGGKQSQLIA